MLHFFQMRSYALESASLKHARETIPENGHLRFNFTHIIFHSSAKFNFAVSVWTSTSAQLARHAWMLTWLLVIHHPKPVKMESLINPVPSRYTFYELIHFSRAQLPLQSAEAMWYLYWLWHWHVGHPAQPERERTAIILNFHPNHPPPKPTPVQKQPARPTKNR